MSKNRLLNKLFEDESFLVDKASVPYIVRDIINMNWWNTCDYMLGYRENKRVSLTPPTYGMKLIGILLKEFYRLDKESMKDEEKFKDELQGYIEGRVKSLSQLKLHSIKYRKNDSQYFYKDGKTTWLDCTSRATYAWKYVGQNGYIDFDGVCRVTDGDRIIDLIKDKSVYPHKEEALKFFAKGENEVKKEIHSQRHNFKTVEQWVKELGIKVLDSRKWLFDAIKHVKTDPYKNNEKELLKKGMLIGNNELLYGFKTCYSIATSASRASSVSHASDASNASKASDSSNTSDASRASCASDSRAASTISKASRASNASDAGDVSGASRMSSASDASYTSHTMEKTWFNVKSAIGRLEGLEHPPVFKKNKYGVAGHWKIDKTVVSLCKKAWFDPFMGHGESPLYAKKHNINYTGIEINPDSMNGFILPYIQNAIDNHLMNNAKVKCVLGDSSIFREELVNSFDLCYTSPPYFDFEDYGFHNKIVQECFDYDEYHRRVTIPIFTNVFKYLISGGILALQTEKDKKLKNKWKEAITSIGFKCVEDTITGQEANKYSKLSKRDQSLLIFIKDSK